MLFAIVGILIFGLAQLPRPAAAGVTAAANCEAKKNKEAGKYAACRANAEMTAAKTAGTCSVTTSTACYRDSDCLSGESCNKDLTKYDDAIVKCDDKLSQGWGKIETSASGACPTTLDRSDIQSLVTDRVDRVAWELSATTRYVDNRDGTITDRKTGLTWEKKVALDGLENAANLHDADNAYPWAGSCSISGAACQPTPAASAACTAGSEISTTACAQCAGPDGTCTAADTLWTWLLALNTAGLGGDSDWRVATREELMSIVDYQMVGCCPAVDPAFQAASCGVACTDLTNPLCSCTRSAWHWAASPMGAEPQVAWMVDFSAGYLGTSMYASTTGYVRAVRGGL